MYSLFTFSGDSESSDSGVDTMSSSTGNSFPSDYMDLDEFLSAANNQNAQESQEVPKSLELAKNYPANGAVRPVATMSPKEAVGTQASPSRTSTEVSTVLNSIILSKVSSLPLNVNPPAIQPFESTSQPTATNAIIQWCKSVGITRQEHGEVMGPEPGKTPVRRRRNTRYVYNPLPIAKKADRKFVTQSSKDEKYWERRIKNNVAAKRSRDMRRKKEIELSDKFKNLEEENTLLKEEVQRLRIKAAELEQRLTQIAQFQSDM